MSLVTEQIKERLDIVDVISSYLKVEKAGINFKAKCPFHNEKTPSFFISPARQSFYCFGCGEKGDIFSFVQKFEGLDFKGALESLAVRAGVEIKNLRKEERPEEKDRLFEIMEKATRFFEKQLKESKSSLEYLKKRGLKSEMISKWRIGFAKDEWRSLHDELLKSGFTREEMLDVGLIKKVESQAKFYDTFRNRIMFPISDSAGRVIAFSGRAMREDDKTPKYLNSPETKLFYKSEVLYGFNIAKSYIRKLDYAVLVEGQMDLLMSHQAGVGNTVASSGTALTELHLKKLQRLTNRIIIAYDSDSAGEKAATRAAEMALSLGLEVKVATMEKGEDPASTVKADPEKWKTALRESEHLIDFVLNKALKENQGRNLLKEVTKSVLPLVSLLKSEMEKSQYAKKIALKTKVSEDAVLNDLKRIVRTGLQEKSDSSEKPKIVNLERTMASIIFLNEFMKDGNRSLKKKWQEISGKEKVDEILKNYEEEKEALMFEAERLNLGNNAKNEYDDILKRIELQNLKQNLKETAASLDNSTSKKEEEKLQAEFKKTEKRINELGL